MQSDCALLWTWGCRIVAGIRDQQGVSHVGGGGCAAWFCSFIVVSFGLGQDQNHLMLQPIIHAQLLSLVIVTRLITCLDLLAICPVPDVTWKQMFKSHSEERDRTDSFPWLDLEFSSKTLGSTKEVSGFPIWGRPTVGKRGM